jgi:hypothetical protein
VCSVCVREELRYVLGQERALAFADEGIVDPSGELLGVVSRPCSMRNGRGLTKRLLLSECIVVMTTACGEFGWRTDVPAISDATFPSAVVVVVAAKRTFCSARLKNRFGLSEMLFLPASFATPPRVSVRPGMSRELR